jgi:hypothetical protein
MYEVHWKGVCRLNNFFRWYYRSDHRRLSNDILLNQALCIFFDICFTGYSAAEDTWEWAAKIKRTAPLKLAEFLSEQKRERKLARQGKTAKAKPRRDSESGAPDQDDEESDDDDDADDSSGTGSDDEDEDGDMESDDEAATVASKSKQSSSRPSAMTSIVCASLIVAPSCTNCKIILSFT